MARIPPSVIPPTMYRHFAVVTLALTFGIAMFAEGENREAQAAQVAVQEQPAAPPQQDIAMPAGPRTAHRSAQPQRRYVRDSTGYDGFDPSFGAPMDTARGSITAFSSEAAAITTQGGYSDKYLASLGTEERAALLNGLDKEGMLSPEERARKSAALIAASENRSGSSPANY